MLQHRAMISSLVVGSMSSSPLLWSSDLVSASCEAHDCKLSCGYNHSLLWLLHGYSNFGSEGKCNEQKTTKSEYNIIVCISHVIKQYGR
jgi:hypothetical protein